MSQTDLALAMNTTKNVISKWKLGYRVIRLDSLYKLSDILEVSLSSLIQDLRAGEGEVSNLCNEIECLPAEQKQFVLRTIRTLLRGMD